MAKAQPLLLQLSLPMSSVHGADIKNPIIRGQVVRLLAEMLLSAVEDNPKIAKSSADEVHNETT